MKTFKTRSNKRSSFSYDVLEGKKQIITAGIDPITGEMISEEWIELLHRMDDREVENNVKNTRATIQKWEKPILNAWAKEHPDEKLPTRMHVSLDSLSEDEDENRGLIAKASMAAVIKESPAVDRLHEVIEMLEPERRRLYQRVVLDEESLTVIAEEEGVSVTAIHNRIEKIKKFIQKNF